MLDLHDRIRGERHKLDAKAVEFHVGAAEDDADDPLNFASGWVWQPEQVLNAINARAWATGGSIPDELV